MVRSPAILEQEERLRSSASVRTPAGLQAVRPFVRSFVHACVKKKTRGGFRIISPAPRLVNLRLLTKKVVYMHNRYRWKKDLCNTEVRLGRAIARCDTQVKQRLPYTARPQSALTRLAVGGRKAGEDSRRQAGQQHSKATGKAPATHRPRSSRRFESPALDSLSALLANLHSDIRSSYNYVHCGPRPFSRDTLDETHRHGNCSLIHRLAMNLQTLELATIVS